MYEIKVEPILTVRKDGVLLSVVDNNLGKTGQVISKCEQMK
jgi:hypothetical protein